MHAYPRKKMEPHEIERAAARIVRARLGGEYRVFLFGSRTAGNARAHSDFDLGIEGPQPVEWSVLAGIREELEDLPTLHKIDVVDFASVSPEFRRVAEMRARAV